MIRQRQKQNGNPLHDARALAALGVILSILSIQQVWAETFCGCDGQGPSSSASKHCSMPSTPVEQAEAVHNLATQEIANQPQESGASETVATHQHGGRHEHGEGSHSAAMRKHAEPSCHHHSMDTVTGVGHQESSNIEHSGLVGATQFKGATQNSESDGSAPPTLSCCHVLPAANLPGSSSAVYRADASQHPTHVTFEIEAPNTVVISTIVHPPRARPIYVTVSSFLI